MSPDEATNRGLLLWPRSRCALELPYVHHEHVLKSLKTFGEQVIQPHKQTRAIQNRVRASAAGS
jgi:hypothetical protein